MPTPKVIFKLRTVKLFLYFLVLYRFLKMSSVASVITAPSKNSCPNCIDDTDGSIRFMFVKKEKEKKKNDNSGFNSNETGSNL